MIKYQYSIFHIPYSRASRKPTGYALLLTIMVMSTMLVIGLTITGIVLTQARLSTRVFNAMKALAMADSGIERGLYEDFMAPPVGLGIWGPTVPNATIGPEIVGNGSYTVEKCPAGVSPCGPPDATTLRSIGTYGGAQRSVEVSY
ncbi:hypothetical protein A3H10_04160 [Candidatus Uhrbacteria bacterium RIFCSPLOWO2_12_FULL_46_10]|uniref:Type 4 fimbrial biogenesis protein PilX N-terminal domain-containing protein n=1 Tax=Candidatus Uhrbacteria bacterium RIFCSPLOWO2_01_FULL_47_25 TaxID=1802402 RepID=A0A1F7UX21_9BACT|nr:MAG: hypothetical protein UX68_C0001G0031 [Parcubacteria group bacterium GW2011_GWA2_46_9]OGL60762.1 MAG: hypothetical protein A2752_03425 [Candidatus Uhrbacteria bacterium RIFCSPHIGHO2_01_FULL_46_23]OGL70064.1 MAG: hypothetical protein A3D60_03300 [Candidatus Uhrbacteria bacterium RIFCSPHIGHO2_02_FULL_47_29]OGL75986.1 MAG: hypothetical protein A3E96_02005 [Candidatus Uhrbacteria bacterium RIFCSPHIGHO2_12_FULL_46_13]OGL82825.1 MAG: hypothetical protein A2936_04125 [Candidatus Uhrbacteria bac